MGAALTVKGELFAYMASIEKHPVLCEEAQLLHCRRIYRWKKHDSASEVDEAVSRKIARDGKRSFDTMVRTNLRMVISIAKRYQYRGLDLSDLIQEGNLGLMRGLELYDPSRGYRITTYAFWWIRQGITRAIFERSRVIRLPLHHYEAATRAARFTQEYAARTGKLPPLESIAEFLKIKPERLLEMMQLKAETDCTSLDALVNKNDGGEGSALGALCGTPLSPEDASLTTDLAAGPATSIHAELAGDLVARLPPQERQVVRGLYFDNLSILELAEQMKFSKSRIYQLRRSALAKLKESLEFLELAD